MITWGAFRNLLKMVYTFAILLFSIKTVWYFGQNFVRMQKLNKFGKKQKPKENPEKSASMLKIRSGSCIKKQNTGPSLIKGWKKPKKVIPVGYLWHLKLIQEMFFILLDTTVIFNTSTNPEIKEETYRFPPRFFELKERP